MMSCDPNDPQIEAKTDDLKSESELPTTVPLATATASVTVDLPDSPKPLQLLDALLKSPEVVFQKQGVGLTMVVILTLCHLAYGVMVGSYSGYFQWFAAPLKITVGTLIVGLMCLPSLYIFASLSGADIRPGRAFSLWAGGWTITSVLLIGFVPVAFIFTCSISSRPFIGLLHLAIWMLSMAFGVRYIIRGIQHFCGRQAGLIRLWVLILVLCMLQMSTTLRPILGHADQVVTLEKKFFLYHWFDELGWVERDKRDQ